MIIDKNLVDSVVALAKDSPRLRANHILHLSQEDKVQKMVNVLLPGTELPIHRHLNSAETLIILNGELIVVYYDEYGHETDRHILSHECGNYGIDIPVGQWHTVIVNVPVSMLEVKEGPYRPLQKNEIFECIVY